MAQVVAAFGTSHSTMLVSSVEHWQEMFDRVDRRAPINDFDGVPRTLDDLLLLKLGVEVWHSRPYHPQSRGKNERFHRTLKDEVFELRRFRDLADVQHAFDRWREVYNFERPHEALGQDVPASRYRPSRRAMPERLSAVDYDAAEIVRRVGTTKAYVSFKGKLWRVPQAFCGERVALRPLNADGQYGIYFGAHQIAEVDLTKPKVSVMSPNRCRSCLRAKHQAPVVTRTVMPRLSPPRSSPPGSRASSARSRRRRIWRRPRRSSASAQSLRRQGGCA
jgi:hypothetical protein